MHTYEETAIHKLYTGCEARQNFAYWYFHKAHDAEIETTLIAQQQNWFLQHEYTNTFGDVSDIHS